MENKEKEIYLQNSNSTPKKKIDNLKADYTNMQNSLLTELFMKMVKNIIPIDYKSFTNKFIKLKEFSNNDTFDMLMEKIKDNQEM